MNATTPRTDLDTYSCGCSYPGTGHYYDHHCAECRRLNWERTQAPEPKQRKRRLHYVTAECSLGFVVRPRDPLDNRRWYFESFMDAEEHANYLERTHNDPITG